MMPIYLEQRFQLLLSLAKEGDDLHIARENLAAAKEMVDTLFSVGHLDVIESRAYRQLCTTVQIMVSTAELKRSAGLPKTYEKFSDGIRAVQVAE